MLIDYQNVRREVHEYCDMADFNTFDEDGIVSAIRRIADDTDCYIGSIDDLDEDTWNDLLDRFDTGTVTRIA